MQQIGTENLAQQPRKPTLLSTVENPALDHSRHLAHTLCQLRFLLQHRFDLRLLYGEGYSSWQKKGYVEEAGMVNLLMRPL